MAETADRPLTTQEVADLFGVTPSAVVRWAEEKKLPCFRTLGGHRRFNRVEVEQLIDQLRRDETKAAS